MLHEMEKLLIKFNNLSPENQLVFVNEIFIKNRKLITFVYKKVNENLKVDAFQRIPTEISHIILSFLDLTCIIRCSKVSRHWNSVVTGHSAQISIWKKLLLKEQWLVLERKRLLVKIF